MIAATAQTASVAQAVANLAAWLETVRQPGGYAGPVAHWWQNRYRYTGPGLDWRYEGLLEGYRVLYEKTGDPCWRQRLQRAATDLIQGQWLDGTYRASCFELNPGTMGTPHEAAATLGLLGALRYLKDPDAALACARRNLEGLVRRLWDPDLKGFNDRPGVYGRVPNKLATLAQAFLRFAVVSGEEVWLGYARAALEDVLRYQVPHGPLNGAIHQYAPRPGRGDGRFFPYYNARCVPPLLEAAQVLGEERYRAAARAALGFLERTYRAGGWPQLLYTRGGGVGPRWVAGAADILRAFRLMERPLPGGALEWFLKGQLPSGAFRTAEGFGPGGRADYRDLTPVTGWNDKALRFLAEVLPSGVQLPQAATRAVRLPTRVGRHAAVFVETPEEVRIVGVRGERLYHWVKAEPWARVCVREVDFR